MSIVYLLSFFDKLQNNVDPDYEFLVIWALFAIADALWVGRAGK